ncbi:hypothetical protein [Komagataeibacter xylinus]|uniref:hypothetical protein n=1 Tax=Komagataeibacter xylinus TaxID=28448 RepID=UPI00280AD03E|nr:hypothetical protein [Komagataeibacter xylinus]
MIFRYVLLAASISIPYSSHAYAGDSISDLKPTSTCEPIGPADGSVDQNRIVKALMWYDDYIKGTVFEKIAWGNMDPLAPGSALKMAQRIQQILSIEAQAPIRYSDDWYIYNALLYGSNLSYEIIKSSGNKDQNNSKEIEDLYAQRVIACVHFVGDPEKSKIYKKLFAMYKDIHSYSPSTPYGNDLYDASKEVYLLEYKKTHGEVYFSPIPTLVNNSISDENIIGYRQKFIFKCTQSVSGEYVPLCVDYSNIIIHQGFYDQLKESGIPVYLLK